MTRAKLSTSDVPVLPELHKDQWPEIERAYGYKLSERVRQEISTALSEFALWSEGEKKATSWPSAKTKITKARSSIVKLKRLSADILSTPDVKTVLEEHGWVSEKLFSILDQHGRACDQALQGIDQVHGFRAGEAWNQLIQSLTAILKRAGLPVGASKGSDKSKSNHASPFVELVYALPFAKPQSREAVAQAISRARRANQIRPGRRLVVRFGDERDDADIFAEAVTDPKT